MYITKEELEEFVNRFPEDETLAEQYARAAEEMVSEYLGYSPEQKEYVTTRYGDNGRMFELEAFPLAELTKAEVNGNELDVEIFQAKKKNYLVYNYGKGVFASDSLYSFTYKAGWKVQTVKEAEEEAARIEAEKAAEAEENQGKETETESSGKTEEKAETENPEILNLRRFAPRNETSSEITEDQSGQTPQEEQNPTETSKEPADVPSEENPTEPAETPSEENPAEEPIEEKIPYFAVNEVPSKIKTVTLQIASLMWESEGGNIAVSSTSYSDTGSRVFNNYKADRFLEELSAYRIGLSGGF